MNARMKSKNREAHQTTSDKIMKKLMMEMMEKHPLQKGVRLIHGKAIFYKVKAIFSEFNRGITYTRMCLAEGEIW